MPGRNHLPFADSSANCSTAPALLVIDDEIRGEDALARWLAMDGFAVECVQTGAEGLARAIASRPDVLVLDLHLPDMLGLTVLSELRRAKVNAPVVVVTGWYLDTDHGEAARALGAAAFVHKPLDGQDLATVVHSAIAAPCRPTLAPSRSTMMGRSSPPRSRPRDDAAEHDELHALHLRLVNGDGVAADRLFAILLPRVQRALAARFRRVSSDWTYDAAVDAFLDYHHSPSRFDPERGVPLRKWLEYPARRNLLNRLDREHRRTRHETTISDRALEACRAPASDAAGRSDFEKRLRSLIPSFSRVELAVLRLWMRGERRVSAFARAAGVAGLPVREQRATVKRLKDRCLKRLRRQWITSTDRIDG
jgi:CheY-like chemotaxis protein